MVDTLLQLLPEMYMGVAEDTPVHWKDAPGFNDLPIQAFPPHFDYPTDHLPLENGPSRQKFQLDV